MKRLFFFAIIGLAAVTGVYAQVTTINSAVVTTHVFNDVPTAVPLALNTYPSFILLGEAGMSAPTGFADRDVWRFSANGTTPYQFQNADYFSATFALTLTGSPITPRKEAGFLFSTASAGDVQFVVNTDGHEIVQFGGGPSYSWTAGSTPALPGYNSGEIVTMRMDYFLDTGTGMNALQFFANGIPSPIYDYPAGGGIGNGSMLGGYFQIVNDPANPANSGNALFYNINIIPEPSTLVLVGLGSLALLLRRRS